MEIVNKDKELYVRTGSGDIKITSSVNVSPGTARVVLDPVRAETVDLHYEGGKWEREYLGEWAKQAPGPFSNLARSGKQDAVAQAVRAQVEAGKNVAVATPQGIIPGREWLHVIGVDLGFEPSVGVVLHKCALCGVAVADVGAHLVESLLKTHHAVCEGRPVEIGDFAEYHPTWNLRLKVRGVVEKHPERLGGIAIRVAEAIGTHYLPGQLYTIAEHHRVDVRRIPRPGAGEQTKRAPKVGDRVRVVRSTDDQLHGATGTITELGVPGGQMSCRVRLDAGYWGAGIPWWCYEVDHIESRGGQHDPAPPRCACGEGHPPGKVAVDPLDVEHDGVKLRELLRVNERECRDGRLDGGPMLPLTPGQRAAVSAHWSAQLRAKVAASREAERNRVRVDPEYLPWE